MVAGRDVAHNIVIEGVWLPEESGEHAAAEMAWARGFLDALEPHRTGVYVNFLDSDDDTSRAREAYGDHIYRRLAEVRAKYDPDKRLPSQKEHPPRLSCRFGSITPGGSRIRTWVDQW